jgi:hypothetical protein
VPVPVPVSDQTIIYWVNRPPPPEHHYHVVGVVPDSVVDETEVVATVRDPVFEAAQKQYCIQLPDAGAGAPGAPSPAKALAKGVAELTLDRSACFGSCPSYSVTLRTDGTVIYKGNQYVRVRGQAFDHVDPAEVAALVASFDAAAAEPPVRPDPHSHCTRSNPDAPKARVTLRRHGREQPMPLLGHCVAPHEHGLVDEIDRVARTERWVTGSKECRERGLW